MKISIALCTYNGAEFLGEQLRSIREQNRQPDELIVCDDCSTDATAEIVREFAARAPFPVRLFVNEQNLRTVKNFEKAIGLCTGDIIALSDQDDVWLPEKLQLFEAEFARDNQVGMVFSNGELVDEHLQPLGNTSWDACEFNQERQQQFQAGDSFRVLVRRNIISGCMMAFRAEFRNLLLPFPSDFPQMIHDYWSCLLLAVKSKIAFINQPLVKYRQHSRQQLGLVEVDNSSAPKLSLAERMNFQFSFDEELRRMTAVQKRLLARAGDCANQKNLNYLNNYIDHLQARTALRNKQASRISTVFREFTLFRYHRYSKGTLSALKDLFL